VLTVPIPKPHGRPILRILLYHGDAETCRHVKDVLRPHGLIHVVSVRNARAILDKVRLGRFDVLITSEQLPDLDAWRLARMLHTGRFAVHPLRIVVLCQVQDVTMLCSSAANHQVRLLSLAELQQLPDIVMKCAQDDPKPWVLIIEDDPRSADLAKDAIAQTFNVEIASDGRSGLAAYEQHRHDLVMLDLALPDIPGETVLRELRKIDPTQPIVIVTANTSLDSHAALVLDGAYDFIVKPFDVNALREACRLAIEQRAHTVMNSAREEMGGTFRELRGRIRAAERMNTMGKNQAATQHLKSAIRTCRLAPLTDGEWAALKHQF